MGGCSGAGRLVGWGAEHERGTLLACVGAPSGRSFTRRSARLLGENKGQYAVVMVPSCSPSSWRCSRPAAGCGWSGCSRAAARQSWRCGWPTCSWCSCGLGTALPPALSSSRQVGLLEVLQCTIPVASQPARSKACGCSRAPKSRHPLCSLQELALSQGTWANCVLSTVPSLPPWQALQHTCPRTAGSWWQGWQHSIRSRPAWPAPARPPWLLRCRWGCRGGWGEMATLLGRLVGSGMLDPCTGLAGSGPSSLSWSGSAKMLAHATSRTCPAHLVLPPTAARRPCPPS